MKRYLALVGTATALAMMPGSAQAVDKSPQAELARVLEGREAGQPVDCITLRNARSSRLIDNTAIVYDGPGNTLYVNYPDSGADALDKWVYQRTETYGSQLCSSDTVQLYDRGSNMLSGIVFLGKFVPYRKTVSASD
jgi:hypothetical protein